MTNETNAALSALKDAYEVLDCGGARHVIGVDRAMDLVKRFGEAIQFLEASQREARVVEGEWAQAGLTPQEMWDEIQAIRKLTDDDGTHGAPHVLVQQLLDRLAERPSVTNFSREAIEEAYQRGRCSEEPDLSDVENLDHAALERFAHENGIDAIFALQLQLPTPSAEQGALISTSPVTEQIVAIASLPNILAKYIPNAEDLHHATQDVLAALPAPAPGKAADEGAVERVCMALQTLGEARSALTETALGYGLDKVEICLHEALNELRGQK